jgi:pimeloyl-ACP methyl ester carboxylesterase
MDAELTQDLADRYIAIGGLRMRYLEQGAGHPVLFMHGASLGSSANVFRRNLGAFAKAGLRAIAFDLPGYGLSEVGDDLSLAYQRSSVPKFIAALGLQKPAIIAHSRSGAIAVQLALAEPERYSHLVVLGTGSLLPPLPDDVEGRYAQVERRVDREMTTAEPTIEDTRKLMQADLFHTELVTPEELALRHRSSIGRAFEVFSARARGDGEDAASAPLWKRMLELEIPLLLIYGRNDRAHAADRAELFKRIHPALNLHIADRCKHMVPWDAADALYRLAIPFIQSN